MIKEEKDFIADADSQQVLVKAVNLGIILNYAIFMFQIKKEQKKALQLLTEEIRDAIDNYDKWDKVISNAAVLNPPDDKKHKAIYH